MKKTVIILLFVMIFLTVCALTACNSLEGILGSLGGGGNTNDTPSDDEQNSDSDVNDDNNEDKTPTEPDDPEEPDTPSNPDNPDIDEPIIHTCSFGDWVIIPSTCITKGSKTRSCECGEEETEELELDPNNHVFSNWVITPATCTVKGNKVRSCECGEEEVEELELDPNNHTQFSDWTIIPSTCTTQGSKSRTCECDYTETEELSLDPNNHTQFSDWTIVPSTCTTNGTKSRTCECDYTETEELPLDSTAHKYEDTYSYNSTYHFYACEYCNSPQENIEHTLVDDACSICDYVVVEYTEGLVFTLDEETDTYSVTDYTGTSTEVIIPYIYEGKLVTSIGYKAFYECSELNSITIPASVTNIGFHAFDYCDNLTTVTFEENSQLTSIGEQAFIGCNLTSITIPASVTSIGEGAFGVCSNLTTVTFEENSQLTSIGNGAFSDSDNITTVNYLGTLEQWLNISFDGYSANPCNPWDNGAQLYINGTLPTGELVIPDTITEIKDYALNGCASITSVTIPASVTSIGDYAFVGCSNLTTVIFEENSQLTSIGEYAFFDCRKLVEVYNLSSLDITAGNPDYGCVGYYALGIYTSLDTPSKLSTDENGYIIYTDGEDKILVGYTGTDTELTLPDGITQIYKFAFYKNNSITSVTIPASVTSIGEGAFFDCDNITTVTFEENSQLTSIGSDAFFNCSKLNSITIPGSVTSIGEGALFDCDNITTVIFEENSQLTSIGSDAFYGCSKLNSITIPASVTSIGEDAFSNCPITYANIPASLISYIPKSNLTTVVINSGTSIGASAFSGCSKLNSITIPASVTSIGEDAFDDCDNLTSITIPAGVTSIGDYAFHSCSNLTTVTFEENSQLTSIGGSAFAYCSKLNSITIPASVTSIGSGAFEYCSNLTTVTFEENSQLTSIGYGAFEYCSNLTTVTFEENSQLTSIGYGAFMYCYNLTTITIPASVTNIGDYAFMYCYKLVEVYNLSSLNITGSTSYDYVGYYALGIYNSLDTPSKLSTDENGYIIYTDGEDKILVGYTGTGKELTLPGGITKIHNYAFYDNENITSITISASVTSIGERAFYSCDNLTTVTFEENSQLTSIGDYAFSSCDNLTSITIPASVTSIGDNAFYGCYKLVEVYNLSSLDITVGSSDYGYVGYYALDVYTSLDTPGKLSTDENGYIIYTDGEDKILVGYTGTGKELTLPGGITEIYKYAFYDNENITSITIPASVTSIGYHAFRDCDNLTTVNYSGTLEQWLNISFDNSYANPCYYGAQLYINGTLLTELVISDTITEIKDYAFRGCTSITSVTIPAGVTSIGSSAFYYCSNLTDIYYAGTEEQWNAISKGYNWDYQTGDYTVNYNYCTIVENSYTHVFEEWTTVTPSTCIVKGTETSTCECGYVVIRELPLDPTAHKFEDTYSYNSTYHFYACEYCNSPQENIEHTLVDDACSYCDYVVVEYTEGLVFTLDEESDTYSVTDYTGTSTEVIIPYIYEGKLVTSIGSSAFYYCSKLNSITIPASVTSIGSSAFAYCSNLIIVTFEENSQLTSIGSDVFDDCSKLTSITIPASVTSIGYDAFRDCCKLVEVYNLSSLDITVGSSDYGYVGYYALAIYTALDTPSKLSTDENGYIIYTYGVDKILVGYTGTGKELTLPSGITEIHMHAFHDNDNITSVTIPTSVTSIGDYAFCDCDNITTITFEENSQLTSIGYYAFCGCDNLTSITIPAGVTSIGYHAFRECDNLTSITIPASVTSIGERTFYDCDKLNSITIPASVTSIGFEAFQYCYKLVEVYNLSSLDITVGNSDYGYVGYYALGIYTSLDTPSKLSTDENGYMIYTDGEDKILVGYNGTGKKLTLPGGITEINTRAFYDNDNITSVTIPASVTSIGNGAFIYCYNLTAVTFEANSQLTSIGDYAFHGCDKLTSITIPASVTSIGDLAFQSCSNLTNIYYTGTEEQWNAISKGEDWDHLTGDYTVNYNYCTIVENSYTHVFEEWTTVTPSTCVVKGTETSTCECGHVVIRELPLDSTMHKYKTTYSYNSTYHFYACEYCNSPQENIEHTLVDDACTICDYVVLEHTEGLVFTLDEETDTYSVTDYTGTSTKLIIPHIYEGKSVTNINSSTFQNWLNLTSIVIPASVTSIGDDAFKYCCKLVEIYNLSSLNITIGSSDYGYVGCYALDIYTSLDIPSKLSTDENGYIIYTDGEDKMLVGYTGADTELTLPGGITQINKDAFGDNNDITSVTIPASVTSIGDSAFSKCDNLTTVIFEENSQLTSIGSFAFFDCDNLTSITIPAGVTNTGGYGAFYDCDNLTSITIPASVTSIGDYAFAYCYKLTDIYYTGTERQWNTISKGYSWNVGAGNYNYTIHYNYSEE